MRFILAASVLTFCSGCGIIKEKEPTPSDPLNLVGKPLPPEQAEEVLGEVGGSLVYGPGLGTAMVNVGTVALFPPYALVLLGNAALSLSGYEPIGVTSFLPEDSKDDANEMFDSAMSGPGRLVAAMAGKEYRTREVSDERLKQLLQPNTLVKADEELVTGERQM